MDKHMGYRPVDRIDQGGQNSPKMAKPKCPITTNRAILATKKTLNLTRATKLIMVSDNEYINHKYDLEER